MSDVHVHSITLVRHGRTAYNAERRLQGQIDIPLDETGAWQVARTGEALRKLYVDPHHGARRQLVVASDLGRAMATAHAFADPLGLSVHPDARVRERGFGEWEGLNVDELAERWPEDWRLWEDFKGGELNHGAEPKEAVGARGAQAVEDWARRAGDDTDLYVFSHGAWISQTLQTLLHMDTAAGGFGDILGPRNAHWARLVPADLADGTVRWRLADYNHGPAIADTDEWEHPTLG